MLISFRYKYDYDYYYLIFPLFGDSLDHSYYQAGNEVQSYFTINLNDQMRHDLVSSLI